ncbi:MAG: hypothetical protein DSY82_00405 [Flavobacteriia bacterium]|nr:MAG: hypothetical protein DSY82_00405 [Flavobacteriia bacterium]
MIAYKKDVLITVNRKTVNYQMAGGIGASWHAISKEIIDESETYKYALRYSNSRGSAWGGNPPVSYKKQWEQIYEHAHWLGLNWIRVELSARMYEPEKNKFDWENEEMQALYNILNWCEKKNVDVFLQQMWSNLKWNSYPDVQPLLSAPESVDDFAEGMATLVSYLTKKKHYSCIKWVCITNEPPGGSWGSWWSTGKKDAPLAPALKAVRSALDNKGIKIPISGPDWTDMPDFKKDKIDFDEYIGAYDIHSYHGIDKKKKKALYDWSEWARSKNKPFFISEVGDMNYGWKNNNPGPKLFETALSNLETILIGLDAGVHAFNRWSFTNRGDLDGQFQLIRTWDSDKKEYLKIVTPETSAYYSFGIITRFNAKYSKVIKTTVVDKNDNILCQSIVSPAGKMTIYILNKDEENFKVRLNFKHNNNDLFLYQLTKDFPKVENFKLDPIKKYTKNSENIIVDIPAKSISTLSEFYLKDKDSGIIIH